jgi:hypothetical protein
MTEDLQIVLRGIFLSIIYLGVTVADDMSLTNIIKFSVFYVIFLTVSSNIGIDPKVVTSAFTTKIIFTLLDQRLNKNEEDKKQKQ